MKKWRWIFTLLGRGWSGDLVEYPMSIICNFLTQDEPWNNLKVYVQKYGRRCDMMGYFKFYFWQLSDDSSTCILVKVRWNIQLHQTLVIQGLVIHVIASTCMHFPKIKAQGGKHRLLEIMQMKLWKWDPYWSD